MTFQLKKVVTFHNLFFENEDLFIAAKHHSNSSDRTHKGRSAVEKPRLTGFSIFLFSKLEETLFIPHNFIYYIT